MKGKGEGCGFFCSLQLPYLSTCLNNFVTDCLNRKMTIHAKEN